MAEGSTRPVQMWAGFECTVNRSGDKYHDQIIKTGHQDRIEDLDLLAELGVKTVRYPVVWERIAPDRPDRFDWSWTDERLNRLRELGITPILGLVHHGSGPKYTSLIDPQFPEKLAAYARAVAERYPWAEMFTPVNEPLTTARFSCLYGHWYPHAQGDRPFSKALLNQMRGTVLAMRAIREVIPGAKLVQTEDLGKTHSTSLLAYQARFENERRWVSFDLLAGKLHPRSWIYRFLRNRNVPAADLDWFLDNPCPPDILGINYYITSERYLDHRIERYPVRVLGGNGRHAYADVEAVRARVRGIAGPKVLLKEAWERYGLPLAITEAHLGCTREEQVRWLVQAFDSACELQQEGADVRAVTAWSLLGAYDWDSLLTKDRMHYETGVYDVRSGKPRPTAVAHAIKAITRSGAHEHPCHDVNGWWHRPVRFEYPLVRADRSLRMKRSKPGARPLLITGETGTLGRAFARLCELRGLPYVLSNRALMDITSCDSVYETLKRFQPWAVVNTAGYVRVDEAESDEERCLWENAHGPQVIAEACEEAGVGLVTFSSDLVFDGSKGSPYVESDPVHPLNVYGKSKALAERAVLATMPSALVVRTSAFFGPWDEHNFLVHVLRTLARGEVFLAGDGVVSPTYVPDLVNAALDLLVDGESGVWHLANEGEVTWIEFGRMAADLFGLDPAMVLGLPTEELGFAAARPNYTVLGSEKGQILQPLEAAMERFCEKLEVEWKPQQVPLRRRAMVL